MYKSYDLIKPQAEITSDDLELFWKSTMSNLDTGEVWCSNPDYLNKDTYITFLLMCTNNDFANYLNDAITKLYRSDASPHAMCHYIRLDFVLENYKKTFFDIHPEATLIWKDGEFVDG